MHEEKRYAVLIDADNVSAKYIKIILDEIANYGVATYKRIYGDWTRQAASSWKESLLENSVTPVQQYNYTQGKNATDSAMIIDAMDILYSQNVEGFCLVSSDSDFTKLASRLRESGMFVVGMGEEKTPKPFIAACNQFKYLDVIAGTVKTNNNEHKASSNDKNMTDIKVIEATIYKMISEIDVENQSINISELGIRIVKRYPDFDVRNYGYKKLSRFLTGFSKLDIHSKGKNGIWVSLKTEREVKEKVSKRKRRTNKR